MPDSEPGLRAVVHELHQTLEQPSDIGPSIHRPPGRAARGATLCDLPETFGYLYDFGDSWHHDIDNLGPGGPEPGCVDGQGACPPEDCGGWPGYEDLRDAIAEPTHPEHEHLTSWAGPWTDAFDREGTDALVRATVGQVPGSVRLLLGLLDGGVRLTPGGRLPRVVVRGVQAERPTWSMLDRPASIEEDLPPLAALHDLLRGAGLLRLAHGVLTPTKAAADDLQTIRRLRQVLEPDSFHDILIGVTTALLATDGPAISTDLAEAALPWLDRWAIGGHPVNTDDLRRQLRYTAPLMQALRPRRPRHRHALGHLAPRALGHHPPAPRHRPGPLPPPVGRHRHLTATGRVRLDRVWPDTDPAGSLYVARLQPNPRSHTAGPGVGADAQYGSRAQLCLRLDCLRARGPRQLPREAHCHRQRGADHDASPHGMVPVPSVVCP